MVLYANFLSCGAHFTIPPLTAECFTDDDCAQLLRTSFLLAEPLSEGLAKGGTVEAEQASGLLPVALGPGERLLVELLFDLIEVRL